MFHFFLAVCEGGGRKKLLEEVSSDPLEVFPCDVSPVAFFSFEDPPVVLLHPTPLHPSYDWGDSWGFMRTDEGQVKVSCSCWTSIPRHPDLRFEEEVLG